MKKFILHSFIFFKFWVARFVLCRSRRIFTFCHQAARFQIWFKKLFTYALGLKELHFQRDTSSRLENGHSKGIRDWPANAALWCPDEQRSPWDFLFFCPHVITAFICYKKTKLATAFQHRCQYLCWTEWPQKTPSQTFLTTYALSMLLNLFVLQFSCLSNVKKKKKELWGYVR